MAIEKPLISIKLPKLSKFPDRTFRLLWIRDLLTEPARNYYKAIFKDINSNMYLSEDIYPECFNNYFAIGLHYKNSELVAGIPPFGKIHSISFESTDHNRICPVSEVLTDSEYNLRHTFKGKNGEVDLTPYNKKQPCVIFEDHHNCIIIPCAVIGATYYFLTSSLRRHVFSGTLKGLYDKVTLDSRNRRATIQPKATISTEEAIHITRFATNEFARSRWMAIHAGLIMARQDLAFQGSNDKLIPLAVDLPVKQVLNMEVRAMRFDDSNSHRSKFLVFEILREDSQFEFDHLDVMHKERARQSDKATVVHTRSYRTTNQLLPRTPSMNLSQAIITTLQADRNSNASHIRISRIAQVEGKYNLSQETRKDQEIPGAEVGLSLIEGTTGVEKKARQADVGPKSSRDEEKEQSATRQEFNLHDFLDMVTLLALCEGVEKLKVYDSESMPITKEFVLGKRLSRKERYMDVFGTPRRYMCAGFRYKGKNVCLLEIDHTHLPNGPSTYVFVSENSLTDLVRRAHVLIDNFVGEFHLDKNTEVLRKQAVLLLTKHHPSKKGRNEYVQWCETLLHRIGKEVRGAE